MKKTKKEIIINAIFSIDQEERLLILKELNGMICKECGESVHPKFYHYCRKYR